MHKLQSNAKMMLFLLWSHQKHKNSTKWILGAAGTMLAAIWTFPFDNLPYLYSLTKVKQIQVREICMVLWAATLALNFLLIYESRKAKYSNPSKLMKEDLDDFNNYFNIPKHQPQVRSLG